MKALIIEDEIPAATRLKKMIESINPSIAIMDVCDSVESSVKWLNNNTMPDIIFMDIEIADGRSFEIFRHVTVTAPVVFITSYNEFAINAIKLNALDYLLKPIDKNELETAIKKAETGRKGKHNPDYTPLYQLDLTKKKQKKLAIADINKIRFVDIDKVLRLQADSNYTTVHLTTGETIVSSRPLLEYEKTLTSLGFFRVHNTHLVNLAYIERYIKGMGGTILLTDGTSIEVSRKRKKDFLSALSQYQ